MPLARISLNLFRHFSLSFITSGRSSGPHPASSHSCWMYVRAGHPAFSRSYVGVHLESGQIFYGVRETDGDKRRWRERKLTAILTHNFYNCSVGRCHSGAPSHSLALSWLTKSHLGASWDWFHNDLTVSHVGIRVYHFIMPTHFR